MILGTHFSCEVGDITVKFCIIPQKKNGIKICFSNPNWKPILNATAIGVGYKFEKDFIPNCIKRQTDLAYKKALRELKFKVRERKEQLCREYFPVEFGFRSQI